MIQVDGTICNSKALRFVKKKARVYFVVYFIILQRCWIKSGIRKDAGTKQDFAASAVFSLINMKTPYMVGNI